MKIIKLVLSILILTSACKKKEIAGCTDNSAQNFLFEATQDDGTCQYKSEISFWYTNETRDSILANGIEAISPRIVASDNYTNFYPTFIVWSAEPDCKTNGIRLIEYFTGTNSKEVLMEVVAYDSTGIVRTWSSNMNLLKNNCVLYEIVW